MHEAGQNDLLFDELAGDWAGAGVLTCLGVEVAISVVTELCEHPGAEDGAQAGLGQVDLSVRVLAQMRIDLLGHGGDLGLQGGQDRHLRPHGRGVGSGDDHRLTKASRCAAQPGSPLLCRQRDGSGGHAAALR